MEEYGALIGAALLTASIVGFYSLVVGYEIDRIKRSKAPPKERFWDVYSHPKYTWAEHAVEDAIGDLTLD